MNTILLKGLALTRSKKIALAIFLDTILCCFSTWLTLSLVLDQILIPNFKYYHIYLCSLLLAISTFSYFRVYRIILRHITGDTVQVLLKSFSIYTIIYFLIFTLIKIENLPLSFGLLQPMIFFILVYTSRNIIKSFLDKNFVVNTSSLKKKKVIIYGAGHAGRQLAINIKKSLEYQFLFFIDDDPSFWEGTIDGFIIKSPISIKNLVNKRGLTEIWLAMPNLTETKKRKIIKNLHGKMFHVRTLPSFSDLTSDKIKTSDVRELNIDELINRDIVKPNQALLKKCITGKTVLVTGAGGSIGSELCRQILYQKPKCLFLLDNSEISLYNIHSELKNYLNLRKSEDNKNSDFNHIIISPLLINIQDEKQLENIFKNCQIDTVYHAAAYKHVPMVEDNVVAGVANNILGTYTCAKLASNYNVKYFVLISTDKAVHPTNVMGASKRFAEIILQMFNEKFKKSHRRIRFCMVRFGNVLGSSGSVVPLFRKQIQSGGPITLTHKDVTRYFMTIKEASQLVIQAGSMSKGGDVFVLNMGKPVKILDLALKMIETSGLQIKNKERPWGDIEIKITGLRGGEKLHEELLISKNPKSTSHVKILKENISFIKETSLNKILKNLKAYIQNNDEKSIKKLLRDNIFSYK